MERERERLDKSEWAYFYFILLKGWEGLFDRLKKKGFKDWSFVFPILAFYHLIITSKLSFWIYDWRSMCPNCLLLEKRVSRVPLGVPLFTIKKINSSHHLACPIRTCRVPRLSNTHRGNTFVFLYFIDLWVTWLTIHGMDRKGKQKLEGLEIMCFIVSFSLCPRND